MCDEQDINQTLHKNMHVVMDGDGMDVELDALQCMWMAEDACKGVAEALSGCSGHTLVVAHVAPPIDGPIVHDVVALTTTVGS